MLSTTVSLGQTKMGLLFISTVAPHKPVSVISSVGRGAIWAVSAESMEHHPQAPHFLFRLLLLLKLSTYGVTPESSAQTGDFQNPFAQIYWLPPEVEAGTIVLWSGSVVSIPAGWALCDGGDGRPDLRDRFVMGAGLTYNPDATGGVTFHTHAVTMSFHKHDIVGGTGIAAGANFATKTQVGDASEDTLTADARPPYYALAYIIKI